MLQFIFLAIAASLCLLSAIDGTVQYKREVHTLADRRDALLGRIAAGYLRALRAGDADTSRIPAVVFREELGGNDIPNLRFRVSDDEGEWIGGDAGMRAPPAAARQRGVVQATVYDEGPPGESLRVAVVRDYLLLRAQAQPVLVQVGEPDEARRVARRAILTSIVSLQLLRVGAVLLAVWAVVVLGFRPLRALQQELQQRKQDDLSLIDPRRPPELAPFVATINRNLLAQQASADQQRRFLADASHQLRTPIAVLRTLVEGTLLGQTTHTESLPKMLGVIERATTLTDQLLSLAKAEQLIRRGNWREVALDDVARDVAMELAPLIARKRLDFSLQALPIILHTDPWLSAELIKNLLANAIHHSPKKASLGIVLRRHRNETEMIVWDHGGGVEADVLPRLFEPFAAAKGGTGIGLGLSICRQIAESMNASVGLFNRIEGGATIGVDAVVRWVDTAPAPGSGAASAHDV
jgi:two-component system, OmpR family, sensor histidine kinase TctE